MSAENCELLVLLAKADYYNRLYHKNGCRKSFFAAREYEEKATRMLREMEPGLPYLKPAMYVNR
jgi:hypothetical protein